MTKRNPARYVVRFRLQTVLVLLTALAVPWGSVCVDLHRAHQRRRAVATQRHRGGHLSEARGVLPKASGMTNGYLRLLLGDAYFLGEVSYIRFVVRTARDLEVLRLFQVVESLRISGVMVTGAMVESLQRLPQLNHLAWDNATLSKAGLERIAAFGNLRALEFGNCTLRIDCAHA